MECRSGRVMPSMICCRLIVNHSLAVVSAPLAWHSLIAPFNFVCAVLSDTEYLPDAVVDAVVVNVLPLVAFQFSDDTDGQWQRNHLIERFEQYLPKHELREFLRGDNTAQCQWKEDDRVAGLSGNGAQDGTERESFTSVVDFHLAHHVGIGKRADDESYERGSCYTRSQTENGMESFLVGPIGSSRIQSHSAPMATKKKFMAKPVQMRSRAFRNPHTSHTQSLMM